MMQRGYPSLATKKNIGSILIFRYGKNAKSCSMSPKMVVQLQRIET
jgi:hypothetical protein